MKMGNYTELTMDTNITESLSEDGDTGGPKFFLVWILDESLPVGLWWTSFVLQAVILSIIDVMGVIFNILSFITLYNEEGRLCSQNVLLMALSVADSLYLIGNFAFFPASAIYNIATGEIKFHTILATYVICPFSIVRLIALYMVVLVTLDRFTVIYYPLQAQIYCTVRGAISQVAIVTVISVAIDVIPRYGLAPVLGKSSPAHHQAVGITTMITTCFLPVILVFLFNSFIIRALRQSQSLQSRRRSEVQSSLTKRLLVVSTCFMLCLIPLVLEGIFQEIVNSTQSRIMNSVFNYIVLFSITCVAINSGVNLILYYLTGARFRNSFIRLFVNPCFRRCRTQTQSHIQLNSSFSNVATEATCY